MVWEISFQYLSSYLHHHSIFPSAAFLLPNLCFHLSALPTHTESFVLTFDISASFRGLRSHFSPYIWLPLQPQLGLGVSPLCQNKIQV